MRGDEQVRMDRTRYGFLPDAFIWRGSRYQVRRVERCWTLARGRGTGRIERRYFRVSCDRGTFDLYHDLRANIWWLSATRSGSLLTAGLRRYVCRAMEG